MRNQVSAAAAALRTFGSVLEGEDIVLSSNNDYSSDGGGLLSGQGGGQGEAPGELGDIADNTFGVNIDF